MAIKYIRFNYFQIRLEPEDLPDNMAGQNYSAPWDMRELINYLSIRRNEMDCVIDLGEYRAEFDRDTFIDHRDPEVFSFQITKLRNTNIPPLKTIGVPREELNLAENQYLGEYITIVFDPTYYTVGVQSNIYSLNIPQVENFFTQLRARHKYVIGQPDGTPLKVTLNPIVDPDKVATMREADIFRKITIKGSQTAAEALAGQNTLNEVSALMGQVHGVNFELTFSIGHAARDVTLNNEVVQQIIDGFTRMGPDIERPKIEITAREAEESPSEVVNLIAPRLTNRIKLVIDNVQNIGHGLIHTVFMDEYLNVRITIARVVNINRN